MMLNEFNKIVRELQYVLETNSMPLKDYVEQYIVIWNKKMEELVEFIIINKVKTIFLILLIFILFLCFEFNNLLCFI